MQKATLASILATVLAAKCYVADHIGNQHGGHKTNAPEKISFITLLYILFAFKSKIKFFALGSEKTQLL